MSLFRHLPAAALFAGAALPAAAAGFSAAWNASPQSCFARHYDRQHLAAHPRQRLTSFSLAPLRSDPPAKAGTFDVGFDFTLKGHKGIYEGDATCHDKAGGAECRIEGDGGSFTMRRDGDGLLLKIERMELEGEADFSPDLAVGGDDRVVRLRPSPAKACNGG